MSCARKPGAVQKKTTWFERQEAYSDSELVFRRSRCGRGSSSLPQKDSPTDTVGESFWGREHNDDAYVQLPTGGSQPAGILSFWGREQTICEVIALIISFLPQWRPRGATSIASGSPPRDRRSCNATILFFLPEAPVTTAGLLPHSRRPAIGTSAHGVPPIY